MVINLDNDNGNNNDNDNDKSSVVACLSCHLNQRAHLPPLLPISSSVVQHNVRGPHGLPGKPGARDVPVTGWKRINFEVPSQRNKEKLSLDDLNSLLRVPDEEDIVPLGDHLAVGRQGLG